MWEETGIRIDLHDCKTKTDDKIMASRIVVFMVIIFKNFSDVKKPKNVPETLQFSFIFPVFSGRNQQGQSPIRWQYQFRVHKQLLQVQPVLLFP
jgi:8-oxo-dGTP pyrophosphatase MutT (NUDIX family)